MAKKKKDNVQDTVQDFINELMSKDWKKMLEEEIEKIRGSKKKKTSGISILAAFALGYLLGSLRR